MTKDNIILRGVVGSHAYGYATADSDIDYMSVRVAPVETYLGLGRGDNSTQRITDAEDETSYELIKFVRMCCDFNANVIPLLFLKEYEIMQPEGKWLVDNSHLFITRKAYPSLIGYAKAQRIKIQKPLTGNPGEQRKKIIENFGYDLKAATHTIRLLNMAYDIFDSGTVVLDSYANNWWLIRGGYYSLDQILEIYDELLDMVETKFSRCYFLLDEPDYDTINKELVSSLLRRFNNA